MRAGSFQFHRNQTRLLGFIDQTAFLGHPFAPLDHGKVTSTTNCRNSSIFPYPNKITQLAPPAAASDLALSSAPSEYGALEKSQYNLFVQFFRQATPYIEGHRGRTFVLVLPGEIVDQKDILHCLLEDIALLHSLGIKLIIVVGARSQIEAAIKASGGESTIVSGMRVTDQVALEAAVEAAGRARMEVEARLSKGPTVSAVRRHVRGGQGQQRYGPGIQTVTGNYVAAKRKGVVNGVDYQYTGAVRFVQTDAIKRQLDAGAIVLLNNLGYSAAGEVLNCNIYDVALGAAADLKVDKLIIPTLPETLPPGLPAWLPLRDAENYLQMSGNSSSTENGSSDGNGISNGSHSAEMFKKAIAEADGGESSSGSESTAEIDMDRWYGEGVSLPLVAACLACQTGVKRAHLIDASIDGSMLLELYSRDGVGTMISTDFYEGIRGAGTQDLEGLIELVRPLEAAGILVARSRDQLLSELPYITVLERESKILACATMRNLGADAAGKEVAELAAFAVHPGYRGGGKGDSLLEFLERDAVSKGVESLVLLTTRTADWFQQRGFSPAGPAHEAVEILPEQRRLRIDPARNSQLYVKLLK